MQLQTSHTQKHTVYSMENKSLNVANNNFRKKKNPRLINEYNNNEQIAIAEYHKFHLCKLQKGRGVNIHISSRRRAKSCVCPI